MTNTIRLNNDGTVFEHVGADTLLRASLRAGVGFPYECNSGGCGACMFELLEGDVDDLWPEAPGLTPLARERGMRLACQSRPTSNCHARVRLKNAPVPVIRPQRRVVTLVLREQLTHDMIQFHFQADAPADFRSGQYALLDLPGVHGSRAYSMSNRPNTEGRWSFIIKRMASGKGSAALFDALQHRTEILLDGPYGNAYLRPDTTRDIVCIAGGSGLSPIVSILASAARAPMLQGRRLMLFYGGRRPEDICLPTIAEKDAAFAQRVECITAISDPTVDAGPNERGFIHEVVQRHIGGSIHPQESDFYFCGPPPMIDAVQKVLLLDNRVPASRLFFDRFI